MCVQGGQAFQKREKPRARPTDAKGPCSGLRFFLTAADHPEESLVLFRLSTVPSLLPHEHTPTARRPPRPSELPGWWAPRGLSEAVRASHTGTFSSRFAGSRAGEEEG